MTRPPSWSGMCFNTSLVMRYMPFRLVSTILNHFESSGSSIRLRPEIPALFTRIWMAPHFETISSTARWISSFFRTSIAIGRIGSPSFSNSAAALARRERLREPMATFARFLAICSPMAFPIPVPPPVTRAILSCNIVPIKQ
jgi:hypothetical protein